MASERVQEMVRDNNLENEVHLHLRKFHSVLDEGGLGLEKDSGMRPFRPKLKEEIEYVEFPHTLNRQFDLIVVDARFRRRCLEEAHRSLKPHGVVFLHDAQKNIIKNLYNITVFPNLSTAAIISLLSGPLTKFGSGAWIILLFIN